MFHRETANQLGRKSNKSDFGVTMNLDAAQAARVRSAFDGLKPGHSVGKGGGGGKKPPKEKATMTDAQKLEKENQKKVRACINQLASKLKDLKRTSLSLKDSKHPVAKACLLSLKSADQKLEGLMATLQQADVEANYKQPVLKTVDKANELIKTTASDVKLGKSIVK